MIVAPLLSSSQNYESKTEAIRHASDSSKEFDNALECAEGMVNTISNVEFVEMLIL